MNLQRGKICDISDLDLAFIILLILSVVYYFMFLEATTFINQKTGR